MQLQTKASLLVGAASVCLLVGAFSRVLRIPDVFRFIPLLVGVALIYTAFQLQKRISKEQPARRKFGKQSVIEEARKKTVFYVVAACMVLVSAVFLLAMPYIVDNFWPGLYIIIIPLQILFVGIALYYIHKKLFEEPHARR